MTVYASPIGRLYLQAGERGLTWCHVRRPARPAAPHPWLDVAVRELDEYFAGTRREFSVPVDLSALDALDARVLATLTEMSAAGSTTTYGTLARLVGTIDPVGVGAALAANPVLIIVPCHRVIGANGALTGYAAGLRNKRRLLDLEAGQLRLIA